MAKLNKVVGNWKGVIPNVGQATPIELRAYSLYLENIENYTLDDLRFMINQKIGLHQLLNLALGYLESDLLIEAGYYEGDLLDSVLSISNEFWRDNNDMYRKMQSIILKNKNILENSLDFRLEVYRKLKHKIDQFFAIG